MIAGGAPLEHRTRRGSVSRLIHRQNRKIEAHRLIFHPVAARPITGRTLPVTALAAHRSARDYIRHAREAGRSWQEIGTALGLETHAGKGYIPVAEAAYDYTAGRADDDFGQTIGRTFVWVCPVCHEVVGDRGPCNGPADDEVGHASGCPRLAAAVAAWREAGPGADSP